MTVIRGPWGSAPPNTNPPPPPNPEVPTIELSTAVMFAGVIRYVFKQEAQAEEIMVEVIDMWDQGIRQIEVSAERFPGLIRILMASTDELTDWFREVKSG